MQPTKQYIGIILGYGEAEVVSTGTDFDQVYKRTGEIWEEQFSKGLLSEEKSRPCKYRLCGQRSTYATFDSG